MSWLRGRIDQALEHEVKVKSGVESDASNSVQRFGVRFGTTALVFREHGCLSLVARTPRTEGVSPAALKCTD